MKRKPARSFSPLLAFAGLVLLGLCVVTALRRQDILAGGLAVLALGAIVLAALAPRLTGTVEMTLSGFKMELARLSKTGRLAGYSEEVILAAIEDKLRQKLGTPGLPLQAQNADLDESQLPNVGSQKPGEGTDQEAALRRPRRLPLPRGRDDQDDPTDPIDRARLSLARSDPESHDHALLLKLLAESLLKRAQYSGRPEELQESIELLRRALATTPQDSPLYTETMQLLADALRFRYYFSAEDTDRDEIVTLLNQLENTRRRQVT